MNTKSNLPPEFASLLAGVMSGITGGAFIEIKQRPGQSIEDAIMEAEAEHLKECPDCQAAEKARVAEKQLAALAEKQRAEVAALDAKQRAEVAAEVGATPEADTRKAGMSEAFGAPYGQINPNRKPVGFMIFVRHPDDMEPARAMPASFRSTEKAAVELVEKFKQSTIYTMLAMFGTKPVITVQPVFAD